MTNGERLTRVFQAFNEHRMAEANDAFDELVVFDTRELHILGNAEVYLGADRMGAFWSSWLPSWRHVQVDVVWLEERGDRVVAWVRQTMTGKESGIDTHVEFAWDCTWRDGRMIRVSFTLDEAEARRLVA